MIGNKAIWLELTARMDVGSASSGAEIQSAGGLEFPVMNAESGESKIRLVCAVMRLARLKDRSDGRKGSDDRGRLCRPGGRVEEAPVGGPPAHHRAYRRGALAWRPLRERGISRRQGGAVAQ